MMFCASGQSQKQHLSNFVHTIKPHRNAEAQQGQPNQKQILIHLKHFHNFLFLLPLVLWSPQLSLPQDHFFSNLAVEAQVCLYHGAKVSAWSSALSRKDSQSSPSEKERQRHQKKVHYVGLCREKDLGPQKASSWEPIWERIQAESRRECFLLKEKGPKTAQSTCWMQLPR